MTAHITYPDIDQVCVSFSEIWLKNILRSKIGFDGVIFSDDLTMKGAGKYNMHEKAMKAIKRVVIWFWYAMIMKEPIKLLIVLKKKDCKDVGKLELCKNLKFLIGMN